MTTLTADFINPTFPPLNTHVKVRGGTHNDSTDPTKKIAFAVTDSASINFNFGSQNSSQTLNIQDKSLTVLNNLNSITFTAPQTIKTIQTQTGVPALVPIGSNLIIEPITSLDNNANNYTIFNSPATSESNITFSNSNAANIQTNTNLIFPTPASGTLTYSLPDTSTTLLSSLASNFTGIQTFNAGLKTDTISSTTINGNMNLSVSGSGKVIINNTQESVGALRSIVNTPLILSGNNTAPVTFGSKGFKFTLSGNVLKDFMSNSFTIQFSIGAFNTGNLTAYYERIGKQVTIRVPSFLGTPSTDGVWTSSNLPPILVPANSQILDVSVGIRNGSQHLPMAVFVYTAGNIAVGLNRLTTGFGTSGSCGWNGSWSFSYSLN